MLDNQQGQGQGKGAFLPKTAVQIFWMAVWGHLSKPYLPLASNSTSGYFSTKYMYEGVHGCLFIH